MKLNFQTSKKVRIEMLPLIDIVFLLLVFFIYAMLSMAVHRGLPVLLPTSVSAKIDKELIVSVTVKSDGTIYVDKEQIDLNDLASFLKTKTETDRDVGILLFADRSLSYQNLFQVLDQIKIAGVHRISLQAEIEQHQ
ncbi:MAG: biopolymer transporter ExbD [Deltaproteobacteria bacterium]|jgi:biopolymer transport protein ExbD|nr:biopolymer transporter ExbD [Deltaproteobacteria bacterium]